MRQIHEPSLFLNLATRGAKRVLRFLRDLRCWLWLRTRTLLGKRFRTILFYPNNPGYWYSIAHICQRMDYHRTSDIGSHYDIVCYWEDATYRQPNELIDQLGQKLQ